MNVKLRWTNNCEISFQGLKTRLIFASMFTIRTSRGEFKILINASYQGLSYVVMQYGKVIAYVLGQPKPSKLFSSLFRICHNGVYLKILEALSLWRNM